VSGLSLGKHLPNLKFVPLAILELLVFNAPKFTGSRDPDHAHFSEIFVRDMSGQYLPNLKFVSLADLELLVFNAQKFTRSRDRDHAHFSERFVRVMSGLSLETHLPNLTFVPLAVLELLASNAQKFTGSRHSRDHDHAHFSEIFVRDMSGLYLRTCLPNLKFVPPAILELLALDTQKCMGSCDPGHAHFSQRFVRVISGLYLGTSLPN